MTTHTYCARDPVTVAICDSIFKLGLTCKSASDWIRTQPQATSGNLRQPQTTADNLGQSQTTSGNLKQPQTIADNRRQPATSCSIQHFWKIGLQMPIDHTSSATFSASPVDQNCEAGTVVCMQLEKLHVGNVVHCVVTASDSWIYDCERFR